MDEIDAIADQSYMDSQPDDIPSDEDREIELLPDSIEDEFGISNLLSFLELMKTVSILLPISVNLSIDHL